MQDASYVRISDFSKVYGRGDRKKTVCSHIDFYAKEGAITGLLGANGAGKSTLLKALCAVHYATKGSICVCGKTQPNEIRCITAFVPETPVLNKNITVLDTLVQESDLWGFSQKEKKEAISFAVQSTSLVPVLSQKIARLSKGFLQRTSLAKALVSNPQVLVLDEFSSGLDPANKAGIQKVLLKLAKNKVVILSTHNIKDAQALCKNIYILHNGLVVASGDSTQIAKAAGARHLEEAFFLLTQKDQKETELFTEE